MGWVQTQKNSANAKGHSKNKKVDYSFYLVTRPAPFEMMERVVRMAVEGGVTIVQLRAKESEARQIIEEGQKLLAILKPLGIPLIINDRVDIAHAIQADGVHLGQSDLTVEAARKILVRESIIGLSVETMEHALLAEEQEVDYIAASPVLPTSTKINCAPHWGLDKLKELCNLTSHPVIAIGGIKNTNIEDIGNCGVSGFALVSALFDSPDPKHAAEKLAEQIRRSIRCK